MGDLEQKIHRLTVMMGTLMTEDEGQSKPFELQVYQPIRGRNQIRGNYHGRFRNNNAFRGCIMHNQNVRGRARDSFIIEETMGIICEVIRDIEIIITITEETVIEVETTTGTEVGH